MKGQEQRALKRQSALDRFFRFFSSLKCGLIFLGLVGGAVTIGTVVLQRPLAREGQIEQLYAPQTIRLLDALGLFDVFHAWWFILLLGLLGANITLASLERFPQAWRLFVRPHLVADEWFVRALPFQREIALGPRSGKEALALACRRLAGLGYAAHAKALKQGTLYVEKHRVARLAPYVVHASLLVIFAGAILDGLYGYRGFISLGPGMHSDVLEPLAVGAKLRPLGFALRCDAAGMDKYPDGSPRQYWSRLAIEENGREVLRKQISVNDPLTYKGVRFFQASYGPTGAPRQVTLDAVWEEDGAAKRQTLTLRPGQAVPLGDKGAKVSLADFVPDFFLEGNEVNTRSEDPRNPALHLQVTRPALPGKEPDSVWLFPKAPEMNPSNPTGIVFHYRGVEMAYMTGLQVAYEPGQWLIWAGCLTLTGGLMMALYLSHIRIWGVVGRDPVRPGRWLLVLGGQPSKYRESFEKRFNELAGELEAAFRASPAEIAEAIPA
jgi:cytochrome c biogenesis protein